MSDDDRPKKSWREIDKAREKSRERRDPDQRQKDKVANSAAYSKYKQNLDKLFTPGGGGVALPEAMRAQLGPTSVEGKEKQALVDALKATPNADSLRALLDKGVPLPADARLLTGLLDVKDEALLQPVLKALIELIAAGTKPSKALLLQRVQAADNFAEDDETKTLLAQLRKAVG